MGLTRWSRQHAKAAFQGACRGRREARFRSVTKRSICRSAGKYVGGISRSRGSAQCVRVWGGPIRPPKAAGPGRMTNRLTGILNLLIKTELMTYKYLVAADCSLANAHRVPPGSARATLGDRRLIGDPKVSSFTYIFQSVLTMIRKCCLISTVAGRISR